MLNSENLTDRQFALACEARRFPVIVSHGKLNTARTLEARLWGTVEDGANGERIFRLNQDGCDALAI